MAMEQIGEMDTPVRVTDGRDGAPLDFAPPHGEAALRSCFLCGHPPSRFSGGTIRPAAHLRSGRPPPPG